MTKKDILQRLKQIRDLAFRLRMGLNVITREEYQDLTSKMDRLTEKLIEDISKNEDK